MRSALVMLFAGAVLAQGGGGKPKQRIADDIRRALGRAVIDKLDGEDLTLEQAAARIAKATKVKVHVTPKATRLADGGTIRTRHEKLQARRMLDWMAKGRRLGWRVKNGRVEIHTLKEVEGKPVMRAYDVADLHTKPGEKPHIDNDDLIGKIAVDVMPWSWPGIEGVDIRPEGKKLIVATIPNIHEEIAFFLAEQRAAKNARARKQKK